MKKIVMCCLMIFVLVILIGTQMALGAKELVTRPDLTSGNIEGIAVRESAFVGTRVVIGDGPEGNNALYVYGREAIDNSPIFFAPSVVKGGTYDFTAYIKLEEDPGADGQLVQLCYAVQSIGTHFATLPCSDRDDGAVLILDTEWTKIEINGLTIETGSENPVNDFGMFLVTWGGLINYYISGVSVIDPLAEEESLPVSASPANPSQPTDQAQGASTNPSPDVTAEGTSPSNNATASEITAPEDSTISAQPGLDGSLRTMLIIGVIVVAAIAVTVVIALAVRRSKNKQT